MTNPFEGESSTYPVLINEEGQHSLWPSYIDVPAGWTVVQAADTRKACLDYVNENWTDMRPKSPIRKMGGYAAVFLQASAEVTLTQRRCRGVFGRRGRISRGQSYGGWQSIWRPGTRPSLDRRTACRPPISR